MVELGRTVFLVEGDLAVRDFISSLVETVGLCARIYDNAAGFLADYDPSVPGCLVTDIRLADMGGLELQAHLVSQGIDIPVIVISENGDVTTAVTAMKAGAVNFLPIPFREQPFLDAVNEAIALDAKRRAKRAARAALEEKLACLTKRERQILDRLVTGRSTREIAADLGVSPKTVDFHRQHVFDKMNVGTIVGLALACETLGIQRPHEG